MRESMTTTEINKGIISPLKPSAAFLAFPVSSGRQVPREWSYDERDDIQIMFRGPLVMALKYCKLLQLVHPRLALQGQNGLFQPIPRPRPSGSNHVTEYVNMYLHRERCLHLAICIPVWDDLSNLHHSCLKLGLFYRPKDATIFIAEMLRSFVWKISLFIKMTCRLHP